MIKRVTQLSLLFVVLGWQTPVHTQDLDKEMDENVESESRNCIPTRSIRRIRIVDDRNVLIYLSSRSVFHNVLRRTCRGLKRQGTFSYNSSDGQLCEGDGISGVNGAWEDIRPFPQCWLGAHNKITREQANAMREASKRGPRIEPRPLPMPEPAEVGDESAEDEPDFDPEV